MTTMRIVLLLFLIICALAVSFSKKLIVSVSIYMAFSLIMSVIWLILRSPDLAITEAAVGAGVTGILFFIMLKKIRSIHTEDMSDETGPETPAQKGSRQRLQGSERWFS